MAILRKNPVTAGSKIRCFAFGRENRNLIQKTKTEAMKPPKLASILWSILSILFLFTGMKEILASLPEFANAGLECEDVLPDTLEVVICEGGPIAISPGSGFDTYLWSTGETDEIIIVSEPGIYCVTVTYQDTCSDSTCISIILLPLPSVTITGPSEICSGILETLTALSEVPIVQYIWSTGEFGTSEIFVSMPGLYCVTVTDENGCTDTGCYILPEPSVEIEGNLYFCQSGSTSITASDGFVEYAWSTGETTQSITVTLPGVYSVTATHMDGCQASNEISIEEIPDISIVIQSPCLDAGDPLPDLLEGCISGYTCQWTLPDETPVDTFTGSGEYCILLVHEASGCITMTCEMLNATEHVVISGPSTICENGLGVLEADPAVGSYLWSTGETTSSIEIFNPGEYCVTAADVNGCISDNCFSVSLESPGFTIVDTIITPDSGSGDGSIILVFDAEYPFLPTNWQEVDSVSIGFFNLAAGTYSFEVVDANGCVYQFTFTVDVVNAVSDQGNILKSIWISPNPALTSWFVNRTSASDKPFFFRLYDTSGSAIWDATSTAVSITIPAAHFPNGLYYLRIWNADHRPVIFPLVKQ